MMEKLEFDIKISSGDLYNYMMRHIYASGQGIVSILIFLICISLFVMTWSVLYLIVGVISVGYLPWTLFLKSKQQALKNPAFKNPLHYSLSEQGIQVSQGEAKELQVWADMYKAVATKRSIIVYTNPVNACIFPKEQLAEKEKAVIEMLSLYMEEGRMKIRK